MGGARLLKAVLALAASAAAADALPRAASTTVCADQYLLALADRDQIASLSWMAPGPYSHLAADATGLPTNRGSLEELVAAGADLVILSGGADERTRRVMAAFGIEAVVIEHAADFAGVAENARRVAAALGRPERGEALVAEMEARLAAAAPPEGGTRPRVVYYRPDGGGAGAGTFVDAVLTAAGYRNMQAEKGQTGWTGLPAEILAVDPPDGFVVSYFDSTEASVQSRLGRNPILARSFDTRPVVNVPGSEWACPHPLAVAAVETLAAARPLFEEAAP
jgi:iron complex transport system substrate-binding protein